MAACDGGGGVSSALDSAEMEVSAGRSDGCGWYVCTRKWRSDSSSESLRKWRRGCEGGAEGSRRSEEGLCGVVVGRGVGSREQIGGVRRGGCEGMVVLGRVKHGTGAWLGIADGGREDEEDGCRQLEKDDVVRRHKVREETFPRPLVAAETNRVVSQAQRFKAY